MGSSLGAEGRAVLGRLALLWALVVPGIQQEIRLSQRSVMVGSAGGAMTMPCQVSRSVNYVHWFRQLEGQAPERLLYLALSKRDVQWDSVLGGDKVSAARGGDGKSCTMSLRKLAKSDEGLYYCAAWDLNNMIFGGGTKVFVQDKNLPTDIIPKPTIFLPSINEVNHQQTATYLCLLENFFPDVIKVSWKEKNGNRVLPSQQGNTMKTNNTYMKFSWLTVTENSMKKEHMCIVRLEKNAGGKDQEILFPAVNEVFSPVVATTGPPDDCLQDESEVTDTDFTKVCSRGESEVNNSTKACLKDKNNTVELQLTYNSAYYTYLLLLLKSAVYFVTTFCCVFRRTGVCRDGKSS
uniref:Ig-like domain-containing protein n=1 Tax=Capra hircus TaxID=9925 RepID=A0A452G5V5_CAPHI